MGACQAAQGVSVSGCRSRCQVADDHPEQGVDAKLKLGWGGGINENLISER